jgi:hypothetical protein
MTPSGGRTRRSRWTDLLLTACGLFVLTVFLMLTSALGRKAGLLAQFFDLHGTLMLAVEVVAILVVAIIVLIVERRESRRRIEEQQAALVESALLEPEQSRSDLPTSERSSSASFDQF